MPELAQWDSFYVIIGSAAGALVGLQFVVMTLIADAPVARAAEAGAAFGTPTTVHFSAVLLLSALLRAPWPTITLVAVLCGAIGFGGVVYTIFVIRHVRRQTIYRPDLQDWTYFVLLPCVAYVILATSAFATNLFATDALFGVGGAALLLLFTSIHNAWDTVAYHVFVQRAAIGRESRDETPRNDNP
jgi:small-conductance mechanosensitive channel